MYQSLDMFQTSAAMARHAGARQAVVASNMANADTPGYQARALPAFQEIYQSQQAGVMRATRQGHLGGGMLGASGRTDAAMAEPAPNGNAVSIELEMVRGVEAQREHSRALAIYRHGLEVIRTSIGR